jgi:hypothetical protein
MRHLWFGLAAGFSLFFAGVIGVIQAQPVDDSRAHALLLPGDSCLMPCWQGIRPGITSFVQIYSTLREHPWVGVIEMNRGMAFNTGLLTWTWRDPPPDLIDTRRNGMAWIENSIVDWVKLPTRLAFGDVWLLLDAPQKGTASLAGIVPPRWLHVAIYDQYRLQIGTTLPCPLRLDAFWQAPVEIMLGSKPLVDENLPRYQLPDRHACQRR